MYIWKYDGEVPDRIYMDAIDVHVSAYLVYVDSEGVACYDEAGEYPIGAERLKDLYIKGAQIVVDDVFYIPISMIEDDDEVKLSYIMYDTVTSKMVYKTVESYKEPTPLPVPPSMTTLEIGSLTLTPEFEPGVSAYTLTVTDESNIVSFTTLPLDCEVVVEYDGSVVTDYGEGITWIDGTKNLTFTLGDETPPVVYTVAITKEIT